MKCKKCGGEVEIDFTKVLTSDPPKYSAKCKDCGNITYPLCSECHSTEGSCLQSIYGAGKINYVGDVIVGSDGTNSCQKPSFTSCYISSIPPQTTEECKIQPKQYGWECPKCGAVMSPDQKTCPFCSPAQNIRVTN